MRILHLGKYYSPVKGGIESTSKYIVDYLSDYEHCVLCFNDKFESKQDIVDGTSVLQHINNSGHKKSANFIVLYDVAEKKN